MLVSSSSITDKRCGKMIDGAAMYIYIYIGESVEAEEGADDDDGEVGRDIG